MLISILLPSLRRARDQAHLLLVYAAGDVIVQVRLEWLLKIFDTDRKIRILRIQAFDDAQLVLMMFKTIMDFPYENRAFFADIRGQFVERMLIADIHDFGRGAGVRVGHRQPETRLIAIFEESACRTAEDQCQDKCSF